MLGNNIRKYRIDLEYSHKELSDKSGVSLRHVQYIESGGKMPSLEIAFKITMVLTGTYDTRLIWSMK